MKKSLLSGVGAIVLAIATSGIASASITVGNPTISGQVWTYGIQGDGLENITSGSYFTIYDFANYATGSIFAPAGWTAVAQLIGTTPSTVVVPDSGGIFNLTFTYTGATEAVPNLSGFGANTTLGTGTGTVLGWFSYQAVKISTGTNDQGDGNLLVPVSAPEPMSLALVGSGLALVGVARLRRRKA